MSKSTAAENGKDALMSKLLAITTSNTVKGRGASGKTTYLDRFVNILLDENGIPTQGKTRTEIIARMSYDIAVEQRQSEQATDASIPDFDLESIDDLALFADLNEKCQNQVAAAVSDSNNSTALSFNAKYKDVWMVVKTGNLVALASKVDATPVAEEAAE